MNHRAAATRVLIAARRAHGGKRPRKMPRQHPPIAIENAYGRELAALVERGVRAAYVPLVQALPALLARARANRYDAPSDERVDAGEGLEARSIVDSARNRLRAALGDAEVQRLASSTAAQTVAYQRIQLGRQLEAALGVDILGKDNTAHNVVGAFVDANTALIHNVGAKTSADVQSIVFRAIQDGKLYPDIAHDLAARLDFAPKRAKLIGRDQVGKLYGQVNALRQKHLGIKRFIWQTVGDDNVRDEHEERDGEEYSYDDPPDGELPGEPILCRCWAEPVLDDLTDDVEDG